MTPCIATTGSYVASSRESPVQPAPSTRRSVSSPSGPPSTLSNVILKPISGSAFIPHAGASIAREGKRSFAIPFSIISQIDGLLSVLVRTRVERDVWALNAEDSACKFFGCEKWRSWSTFCGLFFSGIQLPRIEHTFAVAAQHHALGVFIVPISPEEEWYQKAARTALLQLHIPMYEVGAPPTGFPPPTIYGRCTA